jgi:ATP-dependent exoDNAse (exonuclease V) beta subunit
VMDKPVLSYKSAENWDVYDLDERRSFGTKVHLVLSELKGLHQLTQTISRQLKKGTISKNEAELISETISNLFQDPHFAAYFDHENQLNEKEIIDLNGLKLIPDKIIQLPTHHLVVDFKTGQETPSHTLQVRKYLSILNDMGFENLKGELYYTEEQRFVLVEFN